MKEEKFNNTFCKFAIEEINFLKEDYYNSYFLDTLSEDELQEIATFKELSKFTVIR